MKTYTRWDDVPDHLVTKTQLANAGKRPAPGQQPAALKTGGYGPYDLYDANAAIDKAEPTPAQLAALEKARQRKRINSRCSVCRGVFGELGRHPVDIGDGQQAYLCFICHDRRRASAKARVWLADPGLIILDTETTGLGETDQIVEIAIANVAGETLLDTLVRPTFPISPGATAIHGISDADVGDAPTWAEIDGQVFDLLREASRIVIYNANYDQRMIYQSRVAHGLAAADVYGYWWHEEHTTPALIEIGKKTACAMRLYATWFGDWSSYHKSYRWQKLSGGHRALGDCLATLNYIKEMAGDQD